MVSYLAEENEIQITESCQVCPRCGEIISFGEPADEMLVGALTDRGFELAMENDALEYDPGYYHHECWIETYQEVLAEAPEPPSHIPAESIMTCAICKNGIALGENFGRFQLGKIKRSRYCPDGEEAEEFEAAEGAFTRQVLCMCCMQVVDIADGNDDEQEEDKDDESDD